MVPSPQPVNRVLPSKVLRVNLPKCMLAEIRDELQWATWDPEIFQSPMPPLFISAYCRFTQKIRCALLHQAFAVRQTPVSAEELNIIMNRNINERSECSA